MKSSRFTVTGMSCSACSSHVEKCVSRLKGVSKVSVNLLAGNMQVEYDETVLKDNDIVKAVKKAGYGAKSLEKNETAKADGGEVTMQLKKESDGLKVRLILSVVFWLLLMYVAMGHMIFDWLSIPMPKREMNYLHGNENAMIFALVQVVLLVPILLLNSKYFTNGFRMLFKKNPNMDSLIAIGSVAAVVYGDMLMYLTNKTRPYEAVVGEADGLAKNWLEKLEGIFQNGKGQTFDSIHCLASDIAKDFAKLRLLAKEKIKVGVVGEIYIKYSALGNNYLESFLQKQNCEYMLPGLMSFVMYGADTHLTDYKLYGGSFMKYGTAKAAMWYLKRLESAMLKALEHSPFKAPASYEETKAMAKGVIGYGSNMGEGWLLTAEMIKLAKSGYNNIICAQPFGCLPNHIAGRGMINKIKELVEEANILPIDYDASASKVNQENRIKLMLATAR